MAKLECKYLTDNELSFIYVHGTLFVIFEFVLINFRT
jgi:hypothetical protein